jgi:hypothetical protein
MLFSDRLQSVLFALLVSVLVSDLYWAPDQKSSPERVRRSVNHPLERSTEKLRVEIAKFLRAWLVAHDFKQSMRSFSAQAFANEVILHAGCGGYIKDERRQDAQAIQAGIETFLRDFAIGEKGRSLDEQLDVARFIQDNSLTALNNVKRDRYLLVKLSAGDLGQLMDDPHVMGLLRAKLSSEDFYCSVISVKGGVLYFLWIPEADQWRIYHADMICI